MGRGAQFIAEGLVGDSRQGSPRQLPLRSTEGEKEQLTQPWTLGSRPPVQHLAEENTSTKSNDK